MTSWLLLLALVSLLLALAPAICFVKNLRLYQRAPGVEECPHQLPGVSILIPARDEEAVIGRALKSIVSQTGVDFEVVVMDDQSGDGTADVVRSWAAADGRGRVRLVAAPPLPAGWCGKQHACRILAEEARNEILVFLDADVELEPDALRRWVSCFERSRADLLSGVPWQVTGTWLERLVIPLVHFILLGFLPFERMRSSRAVQFAAGCGQLFITRSDAYRRSGGHSAIRSSLHDGITLPKAYRRVGLATDLFDATDSARCRMYSSADALWNGLLKNAREGLAAPWLIVPSSLVLFGGQILPFLLATAWLLDAPDEGWTGAPLFLSATAAAWTPRFLAAFRFRQSYASALLHPVGVAFFLAIQWHAFIRDRLGRPVRWKDRAYTAAADQPITWAGESAQPSDAQIS